MMSMNVDAVPETGAKEDAAEEKKEKFQADKNERNFEEKNDYRSGNDSDRRRRPKSQGVGDAVFCRPLEVVVRDDRVEQAIRQLKNRMAREGVLRELKNRRHYFKPSELKRIKSREAARRRRKQARQKSH
jgi:small subunit ribosomal protein S21